MKSFTEQLSEAIYEREIARMDGCDWLAAELSYCIAVLRTKIQREESRMIAS